MKTNPTSFLINLKRNNIKLVDAVEQKNQELITLKENYRGIIYSSYLEECQKLNKKPIGFSEKDWIYIIKNSNMVKIASQEKLFLLYKESIKKDCKKNFKKIITLLYSRIILINNKFIIDEDVDFYQKIYINEEYQSVPFYFLIAKDSLNIESFKSLLNTKKLQIKDIDELIDFCFYFLNLKLIRFLLKKFNNYNGIMEKITKINFYTIKNNNLIKSYTNLIKLIWDKDLLFNTKYEFLKDSLQKESLNDEWYWTKAAEFENNHKKYFSDELQLSPYIIYNIKKYKLTHNFSRNQIKKASSSLHILLKTFPEYYTKIETNLLLDRKRKLKPIINELTIKDFSHLQEIFSLDIKKEILLELFNPGSMGEFLIEKIKQSLTNKELSQLLFGKNSTKAIKNLNYLLDGIYLREERLFWSYYLKEHKFNYDLIFNFLKTIKDYPIHTITENKINFFLKELRVYFSDRKILKLISTLYYKTGMSHIDISESILNDILNQLELIKNSNKYQFAKDEIKKYKKNIKSIEDLHSFFSNNIIRYIKQEDFNLNQDKIYNLENLSFESFSLYIPKTNHELIKLGESLDICVGDGYYGEQILSNDIYIIVLQQGNEFKYCIEWNIFHKTIKQSTGKRNIEMNPSLKIKLSKFLKEKIGEINEYPS